MPLFTQQNCLTIRSACRTMRRLRFPALPEMRMSLMNVVPFFQDTAQGAVLLLAVALDHLSRSRYRLK